MTAGQGGVPEDMALDPGPALRPGPRRRGGARDDEDQASPATTKKPAAGRDDVTSKARDDECGFEAEDDGSGSTPGTAKRQNRASSCPADETPFELIVVNIAIGKLDPPQVFESAAVPNLKAYPMRSGGWPGSLG